MKTTSCITLAVFLALCGCVTGEEAAGNRLNNPSFEHGAKGVAPTGWSGKSYELSREPYGPDAAKSRPNDARCFVKADDGRTGDGMAVLNVTGEDKWSRGSQALDVALNAPTRFTFTVYVRSNQTIPASDPSPYVSVRGLQFDKTTGAWAKTPTLTGGGQSTEFAPSSEWTKVTVSKVYPPEIERVRVDVGSYSRDVAIEVDDAELTWALATPEFDVDAEAADLARLMKDAGKDDAKGAALKALFDKVKGLLAVARNPDAPAKDKAAAVGKLPPLIKEYLAEKEALKQSALDSLFD